MPLHYVEQLGRDLERELRMGAALLARRERYINQQAALRAREMKQDVRFRRQKTMQHVGAIPLEEYMAFATSPKYAGCWEDEGFVKDYFKRNPHLRSNR